MRRLFTRTQKRLLYLLAGGECVICGCELDPAEFQGDHLLPWKKGGRTVLTNGQALCRKCNLIKSASMNFRDLLRPRDGKQPRGWQQQCLDRFFQDTNLQALGPSGSKPSFVVNAWPGAGKTYVMGAISAIYLNGGLADRVLVLVPTDNLRDQVGQELTATFGLRVHNTTGTPSNNAPVVVATYQQVTQPGSDLFWEQWLTCRRSLAIGDEYHHVGDQQTWGEAIRRLLAPCVGRVIVTGTLWRTDGDELPYVEYVDVPGRPGDRQPREDFVYGYSDALRDGHVRPVSFRRDAGRVQWTSSVGAQPGQPAIPYDHTTADDLRQIYKGQLPSSEIKILETQRRRSVLSTDHDWIQDTILRIHHSLTDVRAGLSNAAALFVCAGQAHAEEVGALVKRLTGEDPLIVHDKVKGASRLIREFGREQGPTARRYLVAVQMVSEGVDVKRLTHLGLFTTARTQLIWVQMVGRVLRMVGPAEGGPLHQAAYVFQPAEDTLDRYATELEQMAAPFLASKKICPVCGASPCACGGSNPAGGSGGNGGGNGPGRTYLVDTTASGERGSIFRGSRVEGPLVEAIDRLGVSHIISSEQFAVVLGLASEQEVDLSDLGRRARESVDLAGTGLGAGFVPSSSAGEVLTESDIHTRFKGECQGLARKIAAAGIRRDGVDYEANIQPRTSAVHKHFNERVGVAKSRDATTLQLKQKRAHLLTRLAELDRQNNTSASA